MVDSCDDDNDDDDEDEEDAFEMDDDGEDFAYESAGDTEDDDHEADPAALVRLESVVRECVEWHTFVLQGNASLHRSMMFHRKHCGFLSCWEDAMGLWMSSVRSPWPTLMWRLRC